MSGETYVKRYPAGFVDLPSQTTKVDSTFLNAVEAALLHLLGQDPLDGQVPAWSAALSRFVFQLLTNAQIDPAAGIARTKLNFGAGLVDGDIAPGAGIQQSKIAGSLLPQTLIDAKGDLIVGQVDNIAARMGVGVDTSVLMADSTQTLGQKWSTIANLLTLMPQVPTTIGTSLPASPVDGQEAILVDSLTLPTYSWRFKYVAGITDAYKWLCIGGNPLVLSDDSNVALNTLTQVGATGLYYKPATMSLAVPRAGLWRIWGGGWYDNNGEGNVAQWGTFTAATLITGPDQSWDGGGTYDTAAGHIYPWIAPGVTTAAIAATTVIGLAFGVNTKKLRRSAVHFQPVRVS